MTKSKVMQTFSFDESLLLRLPFEIISSIVSLAGSTTRGAAVAIAKKSVKFPITIGVALVG